MLLFPRPPLSQLQDFHQLPPYEQPVHFPAIIRFLLSFHFWESFLEFSKPFWSTCCVSGSGGRVYGAGKVVCRFFAAAFLTFDFFSRQLCFYSLRPRWPTFLLSPCPTSVSQYCLCGSFLLFGRRCVLQSVLPLFSCCGDVFKVTLPACSFNCLEGGGKRVRPDFWLILDFQESVCLPNVFSRLHCSLK